MDKTPPQDAQRRLRELRSIAENKRTDAEWDEINELEIVLAQGNQKSADRPFTHGNPRSSDRKPGGDRPGFQKRPGNQPRRKR